MNFDCQLPVFYSYFIPTQPDEKAGRRPAFEEGKLVLWKIARSFSQRKSSPFTWTSDKKSTLTIRQPSTKRRVKQNPSIYTAKCLPFTMTSDKKSTQTIRQPSAKPRVKYNISILAAKCLLFTLMSDKKSTRTIRQPSAKRRVKYNLSILTAKCLFAVYLDEWQEKYASYQAALREAEGKT